MARKKAQTYHVSQIEIAQPTAPNPDWVGWQEDPAMAEPTYRAETVGRPDRSLVGLAQGVQRNVEQSLPYRAAINPATLMAARTMGATGAGVGALTGSLLDNPGSSRALGPAVRAMMSAPTTPLDEQTNLAKEAADRGLDLGPFGAVLNIATDPGTWLQPEKALAVLPFMMGGLKAVKGAKAAKVAEEALSAARVLSGAEKGAARGAKESLEYMGSHRPQGAGAAPLHDLTGAGTIYPDDVYSKNAVQYYGTGNPALDRRSMSIAHSYKNKPDAEITIFRAVPSNAGDTINPGDWVTINGDYAKLHGESALEGDYKIVSKQVKARDIFTNGDSIHEWGYAPDSSAASPSADPFTIAAPAEAPAGAAVVTGAADDAPKFSGEAWGNNSTSPVFKKGPQPVPDTPYLVTPDGVVMSTRVPNGANAERPGTVMFTGLEEVLRDPGLTKRMAEGVRGDLILTSKEASKSPAAVLERHVESSRENLKFLMNEMGEYAPRSRKWYDGANLFARDIEGTHGLSQGQGSGVIAVLSPQKPWDMNAELGKRLVSNVREFEKTDQVFDKDLYDHFVKSNLKSLRVSLRESINKGKFTPGQADLYYKAREMSLANGRNTIVGQPWSELPVMGKAAMTRAFDEVHNVSQFPILTPEGGIAHKVATNKDGKPTKLVWNSYGEIAKALNIMADGSPENISRWLGWEHKVRSFFDNINVPNYGRQVGERGPSTIDTHQVAGSHMRPMGAKSPQVTYSMGGAGSDWLGISGSNPLYQEALTRATSDTEYLPREGQSIAWEGLKGLFSPEDKRNDVLNATVDRLWKEYRAGRLSKKEVLDAVLNEAKGIDAPRWARGK